MKKVFYIFLMAGMAATVSAQSTREIKGAVIDKNGNPLSGAKIEATGGAESAVTDADGTFNIEVSKWLKSLTATYPGMNTKKENVEKTNQVLFKMTPRQNRQWFVNLVGNVTYFDGYWGSDYWLPGMGLMFGQVGKWGWYGKFMCDFRGPGILERSNYRLEQGGSSSGYVYWDAVAKELTSSRYYYSNRDRFNTPVYYDEKEDYINPGPTITAGAIKSIVPQYFYGFLGLGYSTGYGFDYERCEFTASFIDPNGIPRTATYDEVVDNYNFTESGIAFEGGFIVKAKHIDVMLGYTLRCGLSEGDVTHTFNIGVGYVF